MQREIRTGSPEITRLLILFNSLDQLSLCVCTWGQLEVKSLIACICDGLRGISCSGVPKKQFVSLMVEVFWT